MKSKIRIPGPLLFGIVAATVELGVLLVLVSC